MFAHVVGANCNSPILQITHISNSSPFQIRHVTIHPHSQSPPCYNLPPFQIHPCYNSPYAVACVFPQIANITNCPHCKSPMFSIAHVFNCPHVEGLIAISPYMGVIRTFANIRVNTQKRHHGHGMGSFACVVGAICKSPILQITHVTIHPHVEGLIAISPYTCVIRTFASIRVNTQKRRHGLGMRAFACVVGAN